MRSLWRRLVCWWSHKDNHAYTPGYHYWYVECMKCGRNWIDYD
jgi:hypothetical protein